MSSVVECQTYEQSICPSAVQNLA